MCSAMFHGRSAKPIGDPYARSSGGLSNAQCQGICLGSPQSTFGGSTVSYSHAPRACIGVKSGFFSKNLASPCPFHWTPAIASEDFALGVPWNWAKRREWRQSSLGGRGPSAALARRSRRTWDAARQALAADPATWDN